MRNFVDILSQHAIRQPEKTAFIMLDDLLRETDRLTYAALDHDARSIATSLRRHARPGGRALILHSSGLDFIRTFMGCQYADLVAVPASLPSRHGQYRKRVEHVIKDAGISVIVAEDKSAAEIRGWLADSSYNHLAVVTTQQCLDESAPAWHRHDSNEENIAFIQYTSGSTGEPKGVMIQNRNIIHNSCLIRDGMGYNENLIGGGWLPFFHDMGLIGLVLQPIFLGATAVMMSPTSFIKRPANWLKAISKYRIQSSGGPNFGFEHCLSRIQEHDLEGVDLSCWRMCFSGAEPVRQDTIDRFVERFGRYGLEARAFYPCYGMAETTLFVAGGDPFKSHRTLDVDADSLEAGQIISADPATARRLTIVSCGTTPGFDVAIVHPATRRRISAGRVGEVWLRGESVSPGYWGKPDLSRQIFAAVLQGEPENTWFRTGDLGFIDDGELFICGRLKDVIIVAGRNIYPQDLEARIAELSPLLKGSSIVAFGVNTAGSQAVGIICEMSGRRCEPAAYEALCRLIRASITAEMGVPVMRVVFAVKGSVSRTTSGKLQRRETQRQLEAGLLDTIWEDCGQHATVPVGTASGLGGQGRPDLEDVTRRAA